MFGRNERNNFKTPFEYGLAMPGSVHSSFSQDAVHSTSQFHHFSSNAISSRFCFLVHQIAFYDAGLCKKDKGAIMKFLAQN